MATPDKPADGPERAMTAAPMLLRAHAGAGEPAAEATRTPEREPGQSQAFCTQCGKRLGPGHQFCGFCGAPVS